MDTDKRMPKVAMGAWSWGAGVAGRDQVFGNHLETLADKAKVNTIREWEKKMD